MKKLLCTVSVILALITVLSSLSLISAFAVSVEDYYLDEYAFYGDADNDWKITVKDATLVQKHLAKLLKIERKTQLLADVDGNGKLTISDATDIQKYLANIIYCFEADPTEYIEADSKAIRLELTTDKIAKITVRIPKAGFYHFMSRKVEGGTCGFEIYDGKKHIDYAYGDASAVDTYIYLASGRYTVYLEPSWDYDKDVAEFSVTSAPDKMPIDTANAKKLNPGDRIEIKAGESEQLFKVDPADMENINEGMLVYTEGDKPEVSIERFNDYLQKSSPFDFGEDGCNVIGNIYSKGYLLVKTKEGGSDLTLCCDGYMNYIDSKAATIELDKKEAVQLAECVQPEGVSYRSAVMGKYTPEESGYYKLGIAGKETLFIVNNVGDFYYEELPGCFAFTRIGFSETEPFSSHAYMEAGKTYYVVFKAVDFDEKSTLTYTITKSTEDAYKLWYNEVYTEEVIEFVEPECEVLTLGEKEFVTISSVLDEYDDYVPVEKVFKFTADKDMTVVAYSEGSFRAYVTVTDSKGEFAGSSYSISEENTDFAAIVTLKAGETCYFECNSGQCFGYDDSYYFNIVDIEDYNPVF